MTHRALLAVVLTPFVAVLPASEAPQDPAPFSAAAPVRGVVVDEEGAPQPGVRCWVSGFEQLQGDTWVVTHFSGKTRIHTTGPDGSFEISARTGLRFDIAFDAAGFSPSEKTAVEPGAELRVVMRKGRTVSGRLVQIVNGSEQPIESARVTIRRPNPRGLWFETERWTGSEGRFRFTNFLPAEGGGAEWQLVHGGAVLPLATGPGEEVLDVRIEVRMTL